MAGRARGCTGTGSGNVAGAPHAAVTLGRRRFRPRRQERPPPRSRHRPVGVESTWAMRRPAHPFRLGRSSAYPSTCGRPWSGAAECWIPCKRTLCRAVRSAEQRPLEATPDEAASCGTISLATAVIRCSERCSRSDGRPLCQAGQGRIGGGLRNRRSQVRILSGAFSRTGGTRLAVSISGSSLCVWRAAHRARGCARGAGRRPAFGRLVKRAWSSPRSMSPRRKPSPA